MPVVCLSTQGLPVFRTGKLMAVIYAYFDESGKKGDHPVVTFSGLCATESKLQQFDSAWRVLLRQYELPFFHMVRVWRASVSLSKKLPAQTVDERIEALKPFADCINEHLELGLIQALDVKGFNAMSKNARAKLGNTTDPYYVAFARALLELADYAQEGDLINLVCDDDAETAWDCYRHYRGIRRAHEKVRRKTIALSFADDKHFPALQA